MSLATAFIVVIPDDGSPAYAVTQVPEGLEVHRQPTLVDVRRGALEVVADMAARAAADYVSMSFRAQPPESPAEKVKAARAKRAATPDVR